MPGRIFISYSKADPEPTRALADFLTAQGYTVWWDTNLTSGEVFREVIDRELAAADAAIVIWTAHSVASNWVISEADDAARRNKLITVRTANLEPWRIPKPYNTYQADLVTNRDAVLAAVRRVAGEAPGLSEAMHEALAVKHWQAIKASQDPERLGQFLREYGNTKCGALARGELDRLMAPKIQKGVSVDKSNSEVPNGGASDLTIAELFYIPFFVAIFSSLFVAIFPSTGAPYEPLAVFIFIYVFTFALFWLVSL